MSDLFDDLRSEGSGAMQLDDEQEAVSFTDFSDFDNYNDLDDDPRPQEDRPRAGLEKEGIIGYDSRAAICAGVFALYLKPGL